MTELSPWLTWAQAAQIVGCSETTIHRAVHRGELDRRPVRSKHTPSLSSASVEAMAERWRAQEQARAEHQARPTTEAPDDGHVWVDVTTAALMLDVTGSRVRQWAHLNRIPHERRGHRIWLKREHVEQFAAARAFRQRSRSGDGAS